MNLKVVSLEGQLVTDSRDVALSINREHNSLMKSIRGYIQHLTQGKIAHSNFFIESIYQDSTGRSLPCYLLTKKGCNMVANKMTGEKGVLFTAAYVTKFEEMEEAFKAPRVLTEREQLEASMKLSLSNSEDVKELKGEVVEIRDMVENQITLDHGEQRRIQKAVAIKVYSLESDKTKQGKLFAELHREIKDRFGVSSYKDVKRKELQSAIRYVESWVPKRVS